MKQNIILILFILLSGCSKKQEVCLEYNITQVPIRIDSIICTDNLEVLVKGKHFWNSLSESSDGITTRTVYNDNNKHLIIIPNDSNCVEVITTEYKNEQYCSKKILTEIIE